MPRNEERGAEAAPQVKSNRTRPLSQEEQILNYIIEHGSISSMEAFAELAITRLSARIYDLREQGYDIRLDYRTTGNGKRYGVYTLVEENDDVRM